MGKVNKSKSTKNKVGHPTKYNNETVSKTLEYINQAEIPFIEDLALMLDVNDDTINEWTKVHEEFSAAIKRLKLKQRSALLKASLGKKFNVSGAIFQLKANHGMIETEKKIIDADVKGGVVILPERK